jgi:hypothetical protein
MLVVRQPVPMLSVSRLFSVEFRKGYTKVSGRVSESFVIKNGMLFARTRIMSGSAAYKTQRNAPLASGYATLSYQP